MSDSNEPFRRQLVPEIVGAIISTGLFILLGYLSGKELDGMDVIILIIAGGIGFFVLIHWIAPLAIRSVLNQVVIPKMRTTFVAEEAARIESEVKEQERNWLAQVTGIVQIFPNFRECEHEILKSLEKATDARVFLQIGRTVLSGGTSFYDRLGETIKSGHVRLLHASELSPYLSERVAHQRGSRYRAWLADLDHAQKKVEVLTSTDSSRIEAREHKEGFIWRLFIIDDCAYVQPYLYERHNSENAPVLKISRTYNGEQNENSLYKAFSNYFDQKWEENIPHTDRLDRIIPEGATCAVAGVVRYHQFFVFVIPKRYISRPGRELLFHGIGGKRRSGETYTETLKREALEEIGADLEIESASRARLFTTIAQYSPLKLSDMPRPWVVYKRSRENDPNFEHEEVLWLIAYEAKIKAPSLEHVAPLGEIGALIVITGDLLKRMAYEVISYEDISQAGDGSRVIVSPGVVMDQSRRAVPTGVAALAAAEQTPRILARL